MVNSINNRMIHYGLDDKLTPCCINRHPHSTHNLSATEQTKPVVHTLLIQKAQQMFIYIFLQLKNKVYALFRIRLIDRQVTVYPHGEIALQAIKQSRTCRKQKCVKCIKNKPTNANSSQTPPAFLPKNKYEEYNGKIGDNEALAMALRNSKQKASSGHYWHPIKCSNNEVNELMEKSGRRIIATPGKGNKCGFYSISVQTTPRDKTFEAAVNGLRRELKYPSGKMFEVVEDPTVNKKEVCQGITTVANWFGEPVAVLSAQNRHISLAFPGIGQVIYLSMRDLNANDRFIDNLRLQLGVKKLPQDIYKVLQSHISTNGKTIEQLTSAEVLNAILNDSHAIVMVHEGLHFSAAPHKNSPYYSRNFNW